MSSLEFVDISNPAEPSRALLHNSRGYINEIIGHNLLASRYAYANWHVKGLDWFDIKKSPPEFTGKTLESRGIRGACAMGEKLILFTHGGYMVINKNTESLDNIKKIKMGKPSIEGSPILHENYIITANRANGKVSVLDMSVIDDAKIIQTISTKGNPGSVKIYQGSLIIPDGYGGIRIYDDFFKKISDQVGN